MSELLFQADGETSMLLLGTMGLLAASFTSLLSIANPPAAIPLFLSLTSRYSDRERKSTAKWISFYVFLVLTVFLFAGTAILSFFGISLSGIRIAGGLIIMRAAFSMLNPEKGGRKLTEEDQEEARGKDDISFSPMAMPMLSGPGSIAVVISFATQADGMFDYLVHTVSITLVALISYIVLRTAPVIMKYMGTTGMNVMTRMMGFIALAISVQFILSGVNLFFGL